MILEDKQFVFMIGSPRSGTTWLQQMLGAHPSVCTLSELQLFDFYTSPWVNAWKQQINLQKTDGNFVGLPIVWTEGDLYEFLREFLERVYSRVLATKPGATILLDKTPSYALHTEHIESLVPNAKYIHVIRDGRDVAVSTMAASQGWAKGWAPKNVESAASMWKKWVLGAQKARQYGSRYLEVKYEDLLNNGVKTLGSIFNFVGLPVDSKELASILDEHQFEKMKQKQMEVNKFYRAKNFFRKGQVGDWQNILDPTQRLVFHCTAGNLLCELGYAEDSWWFEHSYQRFTLPVFLYFSTQGARIKKNIIHKIRRLWSLR